jgi:type IV pilus assembly protein PilA
MLKGRSAQAGFTFIELLSVVGIMGILLCLMLPAIRGYVARAKVTEAISALTACRTPVAEIFLSSSPGDSWPSEWGCESAAGKTSKYIASIEVDKGVIRVLTSSAMGDLRISPKYITLAPLARSGLPMTDDDFGDPVFRWRCGAIVDGTEDTFDPTMLPSTCRGF